MNKGKLATILESHKKWLIGEAGGVRANLRSADLSYADLSSANLSSADLRYADLRYAKNLTPDQYPHFQICPEVGAFDCWKKVEGRVIKLRIPPDAKRTSSLIGRKCRAEYAFVLEGSGTSIRGGEYVEGKTYYPDSYDPDPTVECTNGVHFFMTKKEAEEW